MALLITLFLVLINIFNNITTNSPKAEGLTAIEIWMLACILFVFGSLIEYALILFKKQKNYKGNNPVSHAYHAANAPHRLNSVRYAAAAATAPAVGAGEAAALRRRQMELEKQLIQVRMIADTECLITSIIKAERRAARLEATSSASGAESSYYDCTYGVAVSAPAPVEEEEDLGEDEDLGNGETVSCDQIAN